jgi:hypothetical protein
MVGFLFVELVVNYAQDKVRDIKVQFNNKKLVKGLPDTFLTLFTYISTLKYDTCPDYDMLLNLFQKTFQELGGFVALRDIDPGLGDDNSHYDWENDKEFAIIKKLESGEHITVCNFLLFYLTFAC